jgi:hypothetical protein
MGGISKKLKEIIHFKKGKTKREEKKEKKFKKIQKY